MAEYRLIDIQLDESTVVRWSADIEHERRIAIYDLLEENSFQLLKSNNETYAGPYTLLLSIIEGRLGFDIGDGEKNPLFSFRLAMSPFRRIIREYFAICDSYYEAIKSASPSQIEAIDMGRRGLHNEGAEILRDRLVDKVDIDSPTARRLFTLICVLHVRG